MHARRYETLILLSPNLGRPELDTFKNKVDGILAQGQGRIVRFEDWGRRRLAYPVKKEMFGTYFLYDYQGQAALASELERNLKIDENVFKFLTLVLEKDFTDARLEEVLAQLAKDAQKREADKKSAEISPSGDDDTGEIIGSSDDFIDEYLGSKAPAAGEEPAAPQAEGD